MCKRCRAAILNGSRRSSGHYHRVELRERKRAFAHYTRDLGDRLNVCAHGLQVVPCDGPVPTGPVPATNAAR